MEDRDLDRDDAMEDVLDERYSILMKAYKLITLDSNCRMITWTLMNI